MSEKMMNNNNTKYLTYYSVVVDHQECLKFYIDVRINGPAIIDYNASSLSGRLAKTIFEFAKFRMKSLIDFKKDYETLLRRNLLAVVDVKTVETPRKYFIVFANKSLDKEQIRGGIQNGNVTFSKVDTSKGELNKKLVNTVIKHFNKQQFKTERQYIQTLKATMLFYEIGDIDEQ